MTAPVVVVYDANVLYPAALRDLLVRLAHAGLVRARWTEAIHDEWTQNLLANAPHLSYERISRTRSLLNAAVPDCLVEGYEGLIGLLSLPDPGDRHVLAAAIHGEAEFIVTWNLKDFPEESLAPHGVAAVTPDELVCELLMDDEDAVVEVLRQQRADLVRPPLSAKELLDRLESQWLKNAVAVLRRRTGDI